MATVLGLAMRITADASGLSKSLTPVDRALQQLGQQADKSADLFDRFKDSTTGAADAQQNVQRQFAELTESLRSGVINAEEFATQFAAIQQSARETADAFARGAAVTEQAKTAEERRAEQLAELNRLLELGAISQETFRRSVDEVSGANAAALESERNRVAEQTRLQQQADRLTDQYRTDSERRLSAIEQLEEAFLAGRVTSETYERAIRDLNGTNAAAAQAERDRQQALAEGLRLTQQFATAEERRAAELARVQSLFSQGAVDAETFGRAISAAFNIDPAASEAVASSVQGIVESVAEGRGSIEEYADTLASLAAEQQATAEAERQRQQLLEEGKRVSEQVATADEKRAAELQNLERLLQAGAISQETFARAAADASGSNAAAAEAERERASAIAEANRIIQANLTPQERYDAEVQELTQHLNEGRLSQEQFDRALAKAGQSFERAAKAAGDYDRAAEGAGRGGVLQFNELSGILAAIPGPIGNIAGRLSGLSSASEGLGRVFSGGLSQGISALTGSLGNLLGGINPAVAAFASLGAAATQVAQNLIALEDRVEVLGRLADQLGVSFEFVQTLEEAGNRAGVSVQAISGAFARLQNTLAGADEESKAAREALDTLGVSFEEFQQLTQNEQIELVGKQLEAIEDPAKRSAAAIQLFGRSGVQLLPFFREIPGAATDMERFEAAVTDLDRQRLAEFGSGLDALGVAARTLGQELTLPFVGLGEGISQAAAEFLGGINAIVAPIGDVLEPILTQIGRVIEVLGTNLGGLGRVIGAVLQPLGDAFQAISVAIDPLQDFFVDLNRYLVDGAVAVVEWLQSFSPLAAISDSAALVSESFTGVGDTLSRVAAVITEAFSQLSTLLQETFGDLVQRAADIVSAFAEWSGLSDLLTLIGDAFEYAAEQVSAFVNAAAEALDGTLGWLESLLGIERITQDAAESANEAVAATVELTKEQQKARDELDKAFASGRNALDDVIEKSAEFGQAGFDAASDFRDALAELEAQANEGELNAEQYARGVQLATAEYEKQIDIVRQQQEETRRAAEEVQKKADADRKVTEELIEQARIDREFDGDKERAAAAERVLAIEREAARLQEQADALAAEGRNAEADALRARIDSLAEIAQQQEDIADGTQRQRLEQEKLIEADRKRIDALLDVSDEASRVEEDILAVRREQERLARSLAAGEGDTTAQQQRLAELEQLEARLEDQQQAIEQGFGEGFQAAFAAVNQDVNDLIDSAAQFGNEGAAAAQRLQEGIAAAQEQARDGILNAEAFNAEVQRQQQLFEGELERIQQAEDFRRQLQDEALAAEEERREAILEAQKAAQEEQEKIAEAAAQRQRQIFAEQRKAAEAEAKRQEQRIRALNTLGAQTIQSGDIRTAEGAALVQRLAAEAQDPALIEQRRQTRLLQQISAGIAGAAANYFDSPVEIVGFARIGGIP